MASSWFAQFYRSCLFQIIIVGLVSLCEPGIWTALNNLGAGGQASPFLNNAANALTYGLMSVGCTIAGGVSNKITPKWTLFIGAAFYTPYAAGLYCNNRYGNQWFMLLGAGLCGIGASLLWASEAAIAVGYPEDAKRGKYIAIWMGIRQLGPLIGGSISLAINVNTRSTGKVSYNTYLGLIAISALGAPFALLLSQPQKVVRSDGTKVQYLKQTSLAVEARAIWRQLKSPYLLLLVPVFLAGQFGVTYQSNYLTTYFTVRSRALASFLTAVVGFGANLLTGLLLDLPRVSQAAKSRAVYIGVAVLITACWIWNAIVQVALVSRPDTTFDIGGGPFAGSAFAVYVFFRFFYEALQTYLYWLMGEVGNNLENEGQRHGDIARTTGILRSWESIGSTIAYVVGATHWSNLNQMILGFVLWFVTIPPTLVALYGRWEPEKGVIEEETSTDSSSVEEQRVPAGLKG
ncbi:major facilitator superfamily domain-containing protein [Truncatella angustata]|uniref:Major facilitator superfamily domain-containing protein n=1 Tax=Truncatella angustata TaxID=152316 RepID=A0A9P8UVT6_9PEZI|nr:major facilitator superfamily domain-containing protein [Truncatella angustata]KAH6659123.1 major facilitator superfamily domain-containing protein [Truncatella angustata]